MKDTSLQILLANDDGVHARGIEALERALSPLGTVWVIAPDRERSGCSQAISIKDTLTLRKLGERKYSVNGYPVDCVNVGLHSGFFPVFDLVVSGINHGYNLGDDVHYSGTVGAARHAAIHGIRAVAISTGVDLVERGMDPPARFLAQWLQKEYRNMEPGIVYNMNYPEDPDPTGGDSPTIRYTEQGSRVYNDEFEMIAEETDTFVLRLRESVMGHLEEEASDFQAIHDGCVAITPLGLKTTAREDLKRWMMQRHRIERP